MPRRRKKPEADREKRRMNMKRYYFITIVISLLTLAFFGTVYSVWTPASTDAVMKVGFIYENDETTPYTYNFVQGQKALEREFGDKVKVYTKSNVQESAIQEPLQEMVKKGCRIIFTNSSSTHVKELASDYPLVQFCQISNNNTALPYTPKNYHTFNGKIYQGRYVSGIAAGMKLRQLIDEGRISPREAVVGFVGAFPSAEVISGFTAFILGVRSVAPEAVMKVRYTSSWSNYSKEKACAKTLIDEGCIVISQHASTIGPAAACEEAAAKQLVYHVGYNQSMIDTAPTTSLISTRINWSYYIIGAVRAMFQGKTVESAVDGDIHGRDVGAGFERGWVEMLDLNRSIAAEGTAEAMAKAVEEFKNGSLEVFCGDYLGVNAENSADTYDLNQGYQENMNSSTPTFQYILQNVVLVEQ